MLCLPSGQCPTDIVVWVGKCFLPAELAKVVAGAVHEVKGGQVENEDEAGQQDEAQYDAHLALEPNLE